MLAVHAAPGSLQGSKGFQLLLDVVLNYSDRGRSVCENEVGCAPVAIDTTILYRPDEYAMPFFPAAQQLAAEAGEAMSKGSTPDARDHFLRSAAV